MKIYKIVATWTLDYDDGSTVRLAHDYNKAYEIFEEEIAKGKQFFDFAFDENGFLEDNYTIDESKHSWELYLDGCYNQRNYVVFMTEVEIE